MNAIDTMNQKIGEMATREVDKWFPAQCQNNYAAYYLYYKESTATAWGDLVVATEAPKGYTLAMADRLSGWKTKDMVRADIISCTRCLPIVPGNL